jgi:hypothetical protein
MNCWSRVLTSGTALFSLGTITACFAAADDVGLVNDDGDVVVDWDAPIAAASDGRITGDVGPALGVDDDAYETSAWDGGNVVSVENVVALPERVVMLYASITGASSLLRPGTRATFALDDRTLDGPSVVVLGCTGREANLYDEYDAPAEVVDVVVDDAEDGPAGAVDVTMTGHWGDETATSSFRLYR